MGGSCVTPLAGVWIEIMRLCCTQMPHDVTPLAGVWIVINNGTWNMEH